MAFEWEDKWILEHQDDYYRWSDMCRDYNVIFGTNFTRSQFKWHTNQSLGLRLSKYHYTEEQDDWLIKNYSNYIRSELVEKFNETFGTNKSRSSLTNHAMSIGIKLDNNERLRRALIGQEYATSKKRLPIGSIGRPANGYLLIKTSDGWEYLSQYLLKQKGIEVSKEEQTVFLDGDRTNYDIDNLDVMPIKFAPIMMQNKFFSEHPMITKTGIKWCELYQALKDSGVELQED